jgi:hypothetical protein
MRFIVMFLAIIASAATSSTVLGAMSGRSEQAAASALVAMFCFLMTIWMIALDKPR